MKKWSGIWAGALAVLFFVQPIFGATIVTAPIDGRPVSIEYVKNLTEITGDTFLSPSKKNLDFFSSDSQKSRFADSGAIREEIYDFVKQNPTEETTVIINTSSYVTGGLVGSRGAVNYTDYEQALKDMKHLLESYPAPYYYVNLAMPRNLPETRGNKIWPEEEPLRGLGYYYLKHNKNDPNKEYISKKLSRVSPVQMLMEWGYVTNKELEQGQQSFTIWEKEYLQYMKDTYENNEKYKYYLKQYQVPFAATASMFDTLLRWQKEGLLDEIVIGNDDFQLPDFIKYMYKNGGKDWIAAENETPIKFSFSRTYMTEAKNSIYKKLVSSLGGTQAQKSLIGQGESVNFIFGMDEIPQLIYARDTARRNGFAPDIILHKTGENDTVAEYDVFSPPQLLENALSFVQPVSGRTEKSLDLFLVDYNSIFMSYENIINEMTDCYKSGNAVGMIELYTSHSLENAYNPMFQMLLAPENKNHISISNLACYSAWNTNANAIGLGVSHGQIYAIALQNKREPEAFLEAQIAALGQHILEDGVYTLKTKRQLGRDYFEPENKDVLISTSLYDVLQPKIVESAFLNTEYELYGKKYKVEKCALKEYSFPWGRLFDCFLELRAKVYPVN